MSMKLLRGVLVLALLAHVGCGYSLSGRGSFLPAYIKRIGVPQFLGLSLAVAGIALIGWHAVSDGASVTPLGLGLVLAAAAAWAAGNMVVRSAGKVDALAFVVWSSPFSLPPLFALAFAVHGSDAVVGAIRDANFAGWASVLWQALGNTLFGYSAWNWLLARHPAATVAPSALLVPVFGFAASAWLIGEPLQGWKLAAAALVMAGLATNVYAGKLASALSRRPASA